jgi:hypothetical protein
MKQVTAAGKGIPDQILAIGISEQSYNQHLADSEVRSRWLYEAIPKLVIQR